MAMEGGNWNAASVGESRRKMKVRSFLLSYPNLSLRHFVRCDHTLSLRHHTAGQTKATRKRNACLDASDFYSDRSAASSSAIDCRPGVGMAPIFMPREYVRHNNVSEPLAAFHHHRRYAIRPGETVQLPPSGRSMFRYVSELLSKSLELNDDRGGIHTIFWRERCSAEYTCNMPLLAMFMIHKNAPPGCTDLHPPAVTDICGFLETSNKQIAADILMRCGELRAACLAILVSGHPLTPLFSLLCGVLEACNVPWVQFLPLGS